MLQADPADLRRGGPRTGMLGACKQAKWRDKQNKQLTPAMDTTVIKTYDRLLHKT